MKSLYQRLLGDAFLALPTAVRELHGHTESVTYVGRGSVERGTGWLSCMVGALMRFPPAMPDTPVSVRFDIFNGVETWTRQFGAYRFHSTLSASLPHLHESFGWVNIQFQLNADTNGLDMQPLGWRALGMPLPRALWPKIVAREYAAHDHFHFHVEASHPLVGLLVRYRGYLQKTA